jgi:phospholipid:diacylglycerol acyltransferase
MGPLIQELHELGYDDSNLMAAPYDWRLPFPMLETRDGYFTSLKNMIEELYQKSKKPVVIIGHSMVLNSNHLSVRN